MFARRHHLAPYLLLIPSLLAIGILVIWPTIQIFEFSFQNYGLAQLVGTVPKQWIGLSNYSNSRKKKIKYLKQCVSNLE